MKTVFVLVDALKSLYLTEENMPFLYSLSQNGRYVKQIIPCAGFCERSEIFSGLDGYDTGNFTAIGYLPEESPYKEDGLVLWIAEALEIINRRVSRKLFRMWRVKNKRSLNAYRIPFRSLKHFALTEDGQIQLKRHKDIFDELKTAGLSYTLDGFTALSDFGRRTRLKPVEFVESELNKNTDFIPVYIGTIDGVGHRYGKDIDSIRPSLQEVDKQLQEIWNRASECGYSLCVLGDHGMVPVTEKINLMKAIASLNCKLHKDYEAFYDSTFVRFWFKNNQAKNQIRKCLEDRFSKYGFLVDKNNCNNYRIPLDIISADGKPVYGDLIWCANPGILISPDYFHSSDESENGMHGYIELVEGHGTGLFVEMYEGINKEIIERAESSSVCRRLCNLLNIDEPNKNR